MPIAADRILELLNSRLDGYEVSADSRELHWLSEKSDLEVRLLGVSLRGKSGSVLARAKSVQIRSNVGKLLKGEWEPNFVSLTGLRTTLRDAGEDGIAVLSDDREEQVPLQVAFGAMVQSDSAGQAEFKFADSVVRWYEPGNDPQLVRYALDFTAIGDANGYTATGSSLVSLAGGPSGTVTGTASWNAKDGINYSLNLEGLPVGAIPRTRTLAVGELDSAATISGSLQFTMDNQFIATRMEGDITVDQGMFRLPGGRKIGFRKGRGVFSYLPQERKIGIERFSLDANAIHVEGMAEVQLDPTMKILDVLGSVNRAQGSIDLHSEGALEVSAATANFAYRPAAGTLDLTETVIESDIISLSGNFELEGIDGFSDKASEINGTLRLKELSVSPSSSTLPSVAFSNLSGGFRYEINQQKFSAPEIDLQFADLPAKLHIHSIDSGESSVILDAQLALSGISSSELVESWPDGISPEAKAWIADNVSSGTVNAIFFVSGPVGFERHLLEFSYGDANFLAFEGVPPVLQASGSGRLTNSEFEVSLRSGRMNIDGASVKLEESRYLDENPGGTGTQRLHIQAVGPATAIAALANLPSVRLPNFMKTGIVPLSGHARIDAEIKFLPSDKRNENDDTEYALAVDVTDVSLSPIPPGIKAEVLKGTLTATSGSLEFVGKGNVNGLQTAIEVQRVESPESEAGTNLYTVRGHADVDSLEIPNAMLSARGRVPFNLQIDSGSDSRIHFNASADFTPSEVDLGTLGRKIANSPAILTARGQMTKAGLDLEHFGFRIDGLNLDGTGEVLSEKSVEFSFEGHIEARRLNAAGLPFDSNYAIPFTARFLANGDGLARITGKADLTPINIELPGTGWSKPAGATGELTFVARADSGPFNLEEFVARLGALVAHGIIQRDSSGQLSEVRFENVRIGSRSQFTARTRRSESNRLRLEISGNAIDLCELSDPTGSGQSSLAGQRCEISNSSMKTDLDVALQLRRLHITSSIWMEDVTGTLAFNTGKPVQGRIEGRTFGAIPSELQFANRNKRSRPTLLLRDAGAALRALGYTQSVYGGTMRVGFPDEAALPVATDKFHLRMENVTVRDAPLITRILSFISGIGLLEFILGGEERFTSIEMDVVEDGHLVHITDGAAESASVGFVFDGTHNRETDEINILGYAMPVRFLSRLLGTIPIVGTLVEGPSGRTSFGIGFQMLGTTEEPIINMLPIGKLVPFLPRLQRIIDESENGANNAETPTNN